MESVEQRFSVIIKLPNVEVFQVSNNQSTSIAKGTLELAELTEYDSYLFIVKDFRYTLAKGVPVMARRLINGETIYILPNLEGNYGVRVFPSTSKDQIEILEIILQHHGQLMLETEERAQFNGFVVNRSADYGTDVERAESNVQYEEEEEEETTISRPAVRKENAKTIGTESVENSEQGIADAKKKGVGEKSTKVSSAITKSGAFLKSGLVKVATYTSGGIRKAGSYVSSKFVKKHEEKPISDATMNKIKLAKHSTNAFVVFTTMQVCLFSDTIN